MKKITNKIIFIIITCASIISVASLTKTNAQEINRNDLTAYKTDMSSIENETNIRTASSTGTTGSETHTYRLGDDVQAKIVITNNYGILNIIGKGKMKDYTYSPMVEYAQYVREAKIEDGITSIGDNIFGGFFNIRGITIPSSVTSIGNRAFEGCSRLANITIPSSVTSIGSYAFSGCRSLIKIIVDDANQNYCSENGVLFNKDKTKLIKYPEGKTDTEYTIPSSVTSIGNRAFDNCSSLANIIVENDNQNYCSENGVLFNREKTELIKYPAKKTDTEYTIPNSVTSIAEEAFYKCSSLSNITIPSSVTNIGNISFYGCSSITDITIPSSVTDIGANVFGDCSSLTNIIVENDNQNYCSENGVLFNREKTELIKYPAKKTDTEYTISDSVTSIGNCAFDGCSNLTSVEIPTTVTNIGNSFQECKNLISLTVLGKVTIGPSAISGCNTNLVINTICSNTELISYAKTNNIQTNISHTYKVVNVDTENKTVTYKCENCEETKTETFTESWDVSENGDGSVIATLTSDGTLTISGKGNMKSYGTSNSPYNNNNNIKNVIIEEGVTSIGNNVFTCCSSLTSIKIPNSVRSIGNNAFSVCSSLTSIIVDNDNQYYCIENGVLFNKEKTELIEYPEGKTDTEYIIPEGVTSIGDYAFYWCTSLTDITIPEGVTSIGDYAFSDCSSLSNITIPEGVTSIGDYTFSDCSSLSNITIPEGVTSIGDYAFSHCSSLTNITIPSSVTSIGNGAFYWCTSLTDITIPEGVTSIEDYAFSVCSSLTDITIPSSVTSIGNSAFSDCSSLSNITIPSSVTSIGGSAFSGCSSLSNITIPEGVTSIGDSTFYWCKSLTDITIPEGVTSIGSRAFSSCSSLSNITIPNSVTSIGDSAFSSCGSLSNITIPEGVTSIGDSTFYWCKSLTDITIPEGVTSIGSRAFSSCSSLSNITIPNSVTSIGDSAFSECRDLIMRTSCINEYTINYAENNNIEVREIHNYEIKSTTEATCEENGMIEYECTQCEESKQKEILATGHTEIVEKAVPATCTTAGKTEGKYCSVCNKVLKVQEEIPALGHEYGEATYTWNEDKTECTAERVCTRDASHKETETVKTTNSITKEATCEEVGERTYTATFTNTAFAEQTTTEEIPALGHTPGQAVEENRVESTCTQEGSYDEVIYCTVCNKEISRETKTIAKKAHTEVIDEAVEPTCTTVGKTEGKHCSVCNEVLEAQEEIPALGHEYGEATYTWNEDKTECTAERVCTRDASHKETETVKTTNSVTKEATCEEVGERTYTATFTNEAFAEQTTTEEIPATGHTEGQAVEENRVESTCTQEGHYDEVIYCTVCNKEISRETKTIAKKAHTEVIDEAVEPTCETAGKTEGKHCSVCNEVLEAQEEIPATGHEYGEATYTWNEDKTECTAERVCTRDASHKETETVKTTNSVTKEATCEEVGERTYTATFTNTAFAEQTTTEKIKATGHTAGQAVEENRVEATCTQEGHYDEVIYCTVCNKEISRETKTIAKKAHTEVIDEAVEPTCTTAGKTEGKHCSVCNEVLEAQEEIPALGHSYEEATYTWNEDKTECTAERVCTRDASHKETETAKTTNSVTKEATCEEVGERTYTATFTNTAFAEQTTTEEIPALGHTPGQAVEENRVESTCTQEGHYDEVIYCTVCNKEISRETKTIAKKAHTEVIDEAVEPTCETAGKTEGKHCSVCNEVLEAQEEIPALGHEYGEATYTWNEDKTECTAERVCTRDASHKETETAKTTNSVTKEATCEEVGERTYTATFTNTAFAEQTTTEEIPALGHDWKTAIYTWSEDNTTCTAMQKCKKCEMIKDKETAKSTFEITKEATCAEVGKITYTAEFKNKIYETQIIIKDIPVKKHIIVIEPIIEPTCETEGKTEGKYCEVCNKIIKEQEAIPALGHDYEETIIEPTEKAEGYTLHICNTCGKEYKDNFVPAKKAPIQIKDGVKDIEIIEKDDQKYIIVTPNTSTEDLKEKIDSDNKYDINDKDNNNKNGNLSTGDKLIVDDDKNTNYKIIVKGDINGDGKIDFIGDVVLLNNYRIGLIKLSTEALLAGDINQDGKIDFVEDVVKINNFRLNTIKSLNK